MYPYCFSQPHPTLNFNIFATDENQTKIRTSPGEKKTQQKLIKNDVDQDDFEEITAASQPTW